MAIITYFLLLYLCLFRSQEIGNDEPLNALIPEEKMIFMLNAQNMSTMTLAKVKNNYSITEARAVSEEVSFFHATIF